MAEIPEENMNSALLIPRACKDWQGAKCLYASSLRYNPLKKKLSKVFLLSARNTITDSSVSS